MPLHTPLQQFALKFTGSNFEQFCDKSELAGMRSTERADLQELVMTVRKAAAVAVGEAPSNYKSAADPLSRAVENMIRFGHPTERKVRNICQKLGHGFCVGVLEKIAAATPQPVPHASIKPASQPVVSPVSPARQGQTPVVSQAAPVPSPPPAAPAVALRGLERVAASINAQVQPKPNPPASTAALRGLERVAAAINEKFRGAGSQAG